VTKAISILGAAQVEQKSLRDKDCKEMTLGEQLLFLECFLPDAWEYLHDISKIRLPKYDENDEIIKED
jgi:hypothetical protein